MQTLSLEKRQLIGNKLLELIAQGMTAKEALSYAFGKDLIDGMISDLYDDLRAKGN